MITALIIFRTLFLIYYLLAHEKPYKSRTGQKGHHSGSAGGCH
jgi:hypothetical protein